MRDSVALIVVDVQNDFLPGGSLGVPHGDEVVAVATKLMTLEERFRAIVLTQDWHPAGHGSFASTAGVPVFSRGKLGDLDQVFWPDHCVQGSKGAELAAGLLPVITDRLSWEDDRDTDTFLLVQRKGKNPKVDSYSVFFDNGGGAVEEADGLMASPDDTLDGVFKNLDVDTLVVMGLATDYCVKYTVLDARKLGYHVIVVTDGCRGITPAGVETALAEMKAAGAGFCTSDQIEAILDSTAKT